MTQRRTIPKVYSRCLSLLPKEFGKHYRGQILLTAQDVLNEPGTNRPVAVTSLMLDALTIAAVEHIKQLGVSVKNAQKNNKTTPRSSMRAALVGIQIVGVASIAYIYCDAISFSITNTRATDTSVISWYLPSVMPWALLFVAFACLYRAPGLGVWSKIAWAYGLSMLGMLCYMGFGNLTDLLTPVGHGIGFDVLVSVVFTIGFGALLGSYKPFRRLLR